MPQIYQGFGIDMTSFYRGVNTLVAPKSEFVWEGSDGPRRGAIQRRVRGGQGGDFARQAPESRVRVAGNVAGALAAGFTREPRRGGAGETRRWQRRMGEGLNPEEEDCDAQVPGMSAS